YRCAAANDAFEGRHVGLSILAVQRRGEGDEWCLALAADAEIGTVLKQVIRVEGRVEPVAADLRIWVDLAHTLRDAEAQAQRGVHRHRDGDKAGGRYLRFVKGIDGNVERGRGKARALQETEGPRGAEWLVAEFVARDQQDGARCL